MKCVWFVVIDHGGCAADRSETGAPEGRAGVPGTDVEIGGVSPDLEPERGNPTSKARARPGIDRVA
jgi:hypothetical protein